MALNEPWWTWRWDQQTVHDTALPLEKITRWRRGSLLTIYRMQTETEVAWWLTGPFNIQVGVSIPKHVTWDGMPPSTEACEDNQESSR